MFRFIRRRVLLGGVLATVIPVHGQAAAKGGPMFDFAITFTAERGKIASVDCGCFWMNGGSFSGAATFFHGLGVAVNLTGEHAANIQPGVDLDKVAFLAGPRYTFRPEKWSALHHYRGSHPVGIFGEALVGGVHGFNTIFPGATAVKGAASSLVYQFGGGVDWLVTRNVGVRVVEADYLRSSLPNNDSNVQNDLRLAAGVVFHFRPD